MPDSEELTTIGQMCADFGVTARALRFYEDEALLAPERRGTQRLYSPATAPGSPGSCAAAASA